MSGSWTDMPIKPSTRLAKKLCTKQREISKPRHVFPFLPPPAPPAQLVKTWVFWNKPANLAQDWEPQSQTTLDGNSSQRDC